MYQQKSVSEDDWFELKSIAKYWTKSKGFQQWWDKRGRLAFGKPFCDFIDVEISEANQTGSGY